MSYSSIMLAEKHLTPEQVAERLQLNPQTVRRLLRRGEIRGTKRGKVWRIPESALSEGMSKPKNPESRLKAIEAAFGAFAHLPGSVDEFLAEKHAETARRNAKFEAPAR